MSSFGLSLKIDLPADAFEAAEVMTKIKGPWQTMLKSLKDAGVKFDTNRGSGTVANSAPRRPGRPRRTPAPPQEQLPVADDEPV